MQLKQIFIALILFNILHAEEDRALPLANTNGDLSGIVAGHVNVITGDYLEARCDFAVIGPEPIHYERFYDSSDYTLGSLYAGWRHNFDSMARITTKSDSGWFKKSKFWHTVLFIDNSGSTLNYAMNTRDEKADFHLPFSQAESCEGFTNTSEEGLGARTNLKNLVLYSKPLRAKVIVTSSSGTIKTYKQADSRKVGEKTIAWDYYLERESRPNRNMICYYRDNNDSKRRIKEVRSQNSDGSITFGWVRFKYHNPGFFDKNSHLDVSTSDGRNLRYDLTLGSHSYWRIKSISRSDAPFEKFEYESVVTGYKDLRDRVVKRALPEGRYLAIQYYKKKEPVGGVKISNDKDFRLLRVKQLLAPVGQDATPIVTRSFVYDANHLKSKEGPWKIYDGATTVYDAYQHKMIYRYDTDHRLTTVEKYTGTSSYQLHSFERLIWGKKGSQDEGNLIAKVCHDAIGAPQFARLFVYDAKGNVLVEKFYGNMSGHHGTPLAVNAEGIPVDNGCECYVKSSTYSGDNLNLLMSETAPNGKRTEYSYKSGTDLMASKLVFDGSELRQRQFFSYDGNAVLIQIVTDDGAAERQITKITPNSMGLPEMEETFYGTEQLLQRKVNSYSPIGKLLRQEQYDSNGSFCYALEWAYDAHGNCTLEKDALGQATTRSYDANDNLIYEQGPRTDFHKEYTYDFSNRLICDAEVYDNGTRLTKRYQYDYLSNRTLETDIYGNTTRFEYDEFGHIIRKTLPLGAVEAYTYNILGNITSKTDGRGNTVQMRYNVRGKPAVVIYPDGTEERFVYNLSGTLKEHTDRNGMVTSYTYDFLDRLLKKEGLTTTSSTYNAFHLTSETDEMGVVTNYQYNDAGQLISVNKAGNLTLHEYDALGRKIVTKEDSRETHFEYDLLNRIVSEKVPDLYQVDYAYDEMGNRTETRSHYDQGIGITKKVYNAQKQVTRLIDPEGNTTYVNYSYDEPRKEKIDPLGNITTTLYDNHLRPSVTTRKNAIGELTQKQELFYDLCDNKVRIVETVITLGAPDRQILTLMTYDGENRCTSCTEAAGTPDQKTTLTSYTPSGQKATITKPDGVTLSYSYDIKGRQIRLTSSDGTIDHQHTYDGCDRPTRVEDIKSQTATTRTFDALGHPIAETLANGLTLEYSYDRLGRLIKVKLPDNTGIAYNYNAYYLKEIHRLDASDNSLYSHTYTTHDLSGNPLTEKLIGNAGTLTNQYDLRGRTRSIQTALWVEDDIQFDAAGNLTDYTLQGTHHAFSYNDLYQLKTEPGHTYSSDSLYNRVNKDDNPYTLNDLNQVTEEANARYTYDRNGNLIERIRNGDVTSYTYDALDHLTTLTHNGTETNYTYDPFHRRLTKNDTRFLYHDNDEIGSMTGNSITELRLLSKTRDAEIGDAIAIELNNRTYAPIHDHNGNVMCLLDATTGQISETYQYTAFGEEILPHSLDNPWRFSSKRHDAESGQVYFGRRYYSPELGRWTTPDPLGFADGPNLYAYVHNNPLIYIDPDGLAGITVSISFSGPGCHSPACSRTIVYGSGAHGQHSSHYQTGYSINRNLAGGFVNGINNSFEEAADSASRLNGGMRSYNVHSASRGFCGDVVDYFQGFFGNQKSESVHAIHQSWDSHFDRVPNRYFFQECHSRGALDVRNALLTYDPERRKRIHVLAIAPGAYIDPATCGSVVHYRAPIWRDPIPYLDVFGASRARSTIRTINSHDDASFFDHGVMSPTYTDPRSHNLNKFIEIYGDKK